MKELFPFLSTLAVNLDSTVVDYCELVFRSLVWSLIFFQDAFVDDITLVSFLSKLNGIAIHHSPHDLVNRALNSSGLSALYEACFFGFLTFSSIFKAPFPLQDYLEIYDSS